jgi:hypothetical protein
MWHVAKEGPTKLTQNGTFHKATKPFKDLFTPEDIWFTKKGKAIYAISFAKPSNGKINIVSLGKGAISAKGVNIKSVTLLGGGEPLEWRQLGSHLEVLCPKLDDHSYGYSLRIISE